MARRLALPILLAISACEPAPPAIARSGPPQRVVSLAPSCTETLVELGLADRLVGISDYCPELPAGIRAVRVGGLMNPNVEVLLQLKPDLVLTVQSAEDRALATLRRAGVAVRASDPQSLDAVLAEVQALGDLFEAGDAARALVASLQARLAAVRAKAPDGAGRPRLYVEVDHPGCWTIGSRSFVHDAVVAAGAENLFADVDKAYAEVSKEEIVTRAPDWI